MPPSPQRRDSWESIPGADRPTTTISAPVIGFPERRRSSWRGGGCRCPYLKTNLSLLGFLLRKGEQFSLIFYSYYFIFIIFITFGYFKLLVVIIIIWNNNKKSGIFIADDFKIINLRYHETFGLVKVRSKVKWGVAVTFSAGLWSGLWSEVNSRGKYNVKKFE